MPSDDARDRSASPSREPKPKKQKSSGGFKWKEKRPREEEASDRSSGRLERGYRDRSPRRDSYRDSARDRPTEDSRDDRDRSPPRQKSGVDSYRPDREASQSKQVDESPKDIQKKEKKRKKPIAPTEPMIVVNVNDRLGTKAAIPCLASDSVKAFKAMVAAHIGRQPHEIMLKRQGQRPFKDALTLADYEISNGVQLDLELDTGD